MNRSMCRKFIPTTLAFLLFTGISTARSAGAPKRVTMDSLLQEMADRDSLAKLPNPAYTLKQASSHDVAKRDPGDQGTWHSNQDYGQFLRTEVNSGRREWVIMDDSGPGAITRFWLPLLPEHDKQVIRFYFDGAKEPAIAVKFNELLSGRAFVPPPFAFVAWNDTDVSHQNTTPPKEMRGVAGDLYLPIPFSRHCKITLDEVPFYYIINYRSYTPGTPVQTFTMADFAASKPTMERVGHLLTAPAENTNKGISFQATLAPGEEKGLELESGQRAVRNLQVMIDPRDAPQAMRSTIIEASFDGEQSVWSPLGEFFGTGPRLHNVHDWSRTAHEDGKLTARWVMPYQHSGHVAVRNVGSKPITITLSASTSSWRWDERSCYFHANWRCTLDMKTRPFSDWNYIDIQGEGVYVGDTLSVFTPVGEWYGEGDERVYQDGETFPSHIGTGTEDYYGYAWGMASYFSSPFLSTPLRDVQDRGDWRGYTTTSRQRLLDTIPLRTRLKMDMEIWNWADTKVDYAVATFWYARPGAKHNRLPQPQEAAAAVHAIPLLPGAITIAGAIECETMRVVGTSPDTQVSAQSAGLKEGGWSGGKQLFVVAKKAGDFIELEIPVPDSQPRKVILYGTRSYDYGILRFKIDGQPAGPDYDAYAATPAASGPIPLGVFTPKDGKLIFRTEIVGANAMARGGGTLFGLDCVVLEKP